ncbi:MAG: hypothetical protein SVE93_08455 [Candidatus Thermoplasmatota archaeon]|nr:hypothetical protein [Candidatus Thermoplasmatota archaeon]
MKIFAVIVALTILAAQSLVGAQDQEKEIIIIGTAHVFDIGEKVEEKILELKPEAVAVELDSDRLNSLLSSGGVDNAVVGEVKEPEVAELDESEVQMLIILSTIQEQMAGAFQAESGADMLAGIKAAIELGVPVYPIDKHITTTIEGMARGYSGTFSDITSQSYRELFLMLFSFLRAVVEILVGIALSFITSPIVSLKFSLSSLVDTLSASSLTEPLISFLTLSCSSLPVCLTLAIGSKMGIEGLREFYSFMPELYDSLLADREEYMADRIAEIPESRIVVVTGAAHTTGLATELEERMPGAKIEVMTFLDLF